VALRDLGVGAPRRRRPHGSLAAATAVANVSEGAGRGGDRRAIGNGMVADSLRLHLTWDPPAAGPARSSPRWPRRERRAARRRRLTRTYLSRPASTNELASTVDVRCPTSYLSIYDPASGDYVVLLQDMAPAVTGDQLTGCSVDEARRSPAQLAALHAPRGPTPPSSGSTGWSARRPSGRRLQRGCSVALARVRRALRPPRGFRCRRPHGRLLRHLPRILAAPPRRDAPPRRLPPGQPALRRRRVVVLDWQRSGSARP